MRNSVEDRVSEGQDIIDSRDVIERIEKLEGERENLVDALKEREETYKAAPPGDDEALDDARSAVEEKRMDLEAWDEGDEGRELTALKALADECEACKGMKKRGEPRIV
jgi:hypothetical protein